MRIFTGSLLATHLAIVVWAMGVSAATSKELVLQASEIKAASVLTPKSKIVHPRVPLTGTLLEYLNAVVHSNGVGKVTTVTLKKCVQAKSHTCVQFIGKACPEGVRGDCEGLDLTIFVDVTSKPPRLDRGFASMPEDSVHDQSDIEKFLSEAP